MDGIRRLRMSIKGVVQGVGFRPFIYNLARSLTLSGWVNNTADGVILEAEGKKAALENFARCISAGAPPLAVIEEVTAAWLEPANYKQFSINQSEGDGSKFTLIAPDVATCPQCLDELNDPHNRRYRYPFINCTNCGPRFTIIKDVPYDRSFTTMMNFPMCSDCLKEYHNPVDRRFHAQPNACSVCGPQVALLDRRGQQVIVQEPVAKAVKLLQDGQILAVKGLGGYHLVCDALNGSTVQRLRLLKHREAKPFAVMMSDMQVVKRHCWVSKDEELVLKSEKRPIVLLKKKSDLPVAKEVALYSPYLGVMLPYTPLHWLLFSEGAEVLVVTSGNSSGEAVEYLDKEAIDNLSSIADYFLTHNRDIYIRTEDSVVRFFMGREILIRRSRGYAPMPIKLPFNADGILATGAELKNTICLTKGNKAFLSQYIGDLENLSNVLFFEQAVEHLQKIFNITPRVAAYDLHPEYLSSKYALEFPGLTKFPVQHHHAHVASCMVENGLLGDVIGVAFDGTGYGMDGNIWGGEFFTGSYQGFNRWAHFEYISLPGGAAAIKQPWRMAVSYLESLGRNTMELSLPFLKSIDPFMLDRVIKLAANECGNPLTSSVGRLFDAVAALLGVRQEISYEGQAAIELEQLAADVLDGGSYKFVIRKDSQPWIISLTGMFDEIIDELLHKVSVKAIALRFHITVSEIIAATCCQIRQETGINSVVLSGGVFQNMLLLGRSVSRLQMEGFKVYTHSKVPANDGGISLGQAAMAGGGLVERGGL